MTKIKTNINTNSPDRVVVVGTSAGGLQALKILTSQLQQSFPAPVLVVQHISNPYSGEALLRVLSKSTALNCQIAENGSKIIPGQLYLAPPDQHMMIGGDKTILLTKGAPENRARPSIDALFRSAAVNFNTSVIAVLLTGYLDDGTSGMKAVLRCGGTTIVQDPAEAEYPDMPQNALNFISIDHVVPLLEMGGLIYQLMMKKPKKPKSIPEDVVIESKIAERVLSDLKSVNALGDQVPFNCPGCGGVLWKISNDSDLRFRCHTGHAYTAASLLEEQNNKIEDTLWTALRMFEERKNLITQTGMGKKGPVGKTAIERAELSEVHIQRIREMLKAVDRSKNAFRKN